MNRKSWLLGLVSLLFFTTTAWGSERITLPLTDAPARGPATATVTLVEFLDFQ